MQTGAMVLGIIGGLVGLTIAFWFGVIVGMGEELGAETGMTTRAFLGFILALAGLTGGAIVKGRAQMGGLLMLISGIGGFLTNGVLWFFAAIPLLIGGGIAFLRAK